MQKSINKTGIKAAILTMSFVQMGTNGIAVILAAIAGQFPAADTATIQFLMTCPSIFVVIITLLTARLSATIEKRKLIVTGLSLVMLAGALSYFFHGILSLLFVWAGLLGIGIGLVVPNAYALISDCFEGKEKGELMGWQSTAANFGSMMMTFAGGFLASIHWYMDYLVYFVAIPGLVLTLLFIPKGQNKKEETKHQETKVKIPKRVWNYCSIIALFMLFFYIGPMNLSLLVMEQTVINPEVIGTAITTLLLGGAVMGMLFGKLSAKLGSYCIPLGFLVLGLGFLILNQANNSVCLILGTFIAGASVSITLPQCMILISKNQDSHVNSLALAFGMASGNFGTFAAPILTKVSKMIMKTESASSRLFFCGVVSIVIASFMLIRFRKSVSRISKEI